MVEIKQKGWILVEAVSKNTQNAISAKRTKRPQGKAFADFINNLGKTTAPKKNQHIAQSAESKFAESKLAQSAESKLAQSAESTKKTTQNFNQNLIKKVDFKSDSAQKADILSNLLSEKNEENLKSTPQKSPLDMILSRPKATQSKLNQTPEIKNNNAESNAESNAKSSVESSAESNAKLSAESTPKSTQNLKNLAMDSTKDLTQDSMKDSIKDSTRNSIKNSTKDSAIKLQKNKVENPQNIQLDSTKDSNLALDSKNDSTKDLAQDSIKNLVQDSTKDSTKDSTPKNNEAQNINAENKSNLGIKNTLKYGAFKAFDALSLLKPSDGKKLSDLIKKADELALNLQSIKYTKMGENKNIFDGIKTQNANEIKENATQNLAQNSTQNLAQKKDILIDSTTTNAPKKIDEKNSKNIQTKNESQIQNNDLKSNKITEQKLAEPKAESPLKNALENSDIKPINFDKSAESKLAESKSTESKLESKKEIATDLKDSTKDALKQENAPLSNEQSTAKIANKIFDARESMKNFAYALKQEIQNHKPPLSKITIELQPANLGSVEVSIISQGKNIQIQLHSNQQTLNLFIQNQSDLRTALAQIGYENVAMSFNNGAQMGFSDNSGKWRYESAPKNRNAFSLNDSDESEIFEIMITNNYA